MGSRRHNPEKRAWRGRSYRKGGQNIRELKDKNMTDKEVKELQELIDWGDPIANGLAKLLVDALVAERKAKEDALKCLLAITNCGYCAYCRERHSKP